MGEGVYTTKNPQYWFAQMAYEDVGDTPEHVYLVFVKNGDVGSVWSAHQDLSEPQDVTVLTKLMTIPPEQHMDVGKLYWLADKFLKSHPLPSEPSPTV